MIAIENRGPLIFRTECGKDVGLGHLKRCQTLAQAVRSIAEVEIIFVVNREAVGQVAGFPTVISDNFDKKDVALIKAFNPSLIVYDSYTGTDQYLRELSMITSVAAFDDNCELPKNVPLEILVNGNLHAVDLDYNCWKIRKKLLGPKYLVVDPEFQNISVENRSSGILLTTGGSDPQCLMPRFLKSLQGLRKTKTLILGPFYDRNEIKEIETLADETCELIYSPKSLIRYIQGSELVITACGSTVYQVLLLKKPLITYSVADNQILIEKKLKEYGVVSLGWYKEIDWAGLRGRVEKLCNTRKEYVQRIHALFSLFDGKGSLRVAQEIVDSIIHK